VTGTDLLHGGTLATPDGCRLVYAAEGTGPTVVFAHGGLGRASTWMGVVDLLRDRFHCVLFDQRAHGASDWGGGPDVDRAAHDLLFVVDRLGPVHAVVGHSYGALVALEATRLAPAGTIPRLAVYEPPLSVGGPIMSDEGIGRVEAAVAAGDFEAAVLLHLGSDSGGLSDAEVDAFRSNPMLRTAYAEIVVQAPSIAPALRSCTRLTSAEPYRGIDVPTLLLLGFASAPHPFRTSIDALLDAIPHARLALLEGQTHTAVMFAPQLVADELGRFLGE
jgi:pimeloyl-ACP methyl ester carboxylesterase